MKGNDELEIIEDLTETNSDATIPNQNTEDSIIPTISKEEVQHALNVEDIVSTPQVEKDEDKSSSETDNQIKADTKLINPFANTYPGADEKDKTYNAYNIMNNVPDSFEIKEDVNPITRSDLEDKNKEQSKMRSSRPVRIINNYNGTNDRPSIFAKVASEDELLEQFVGKNHFKILSNNFNICAMLFGPFYLWYRKMFLASYIYIMIMTLLTYGLVFVFKYNNPVYELILYTVGSIALGLSFNKLYIKKAKRKVNKINEKYSGQMDAFEVGRKCSKKGGGSILSMLLGMISFTLITIVVTIIATIIIAFITFGTLTDYKFDINEVKNKYEFNFDFSKLFDFNKDKTPKPEYYDTVDSFYTSVKSRWSRDIVKSSGEKKYFKSGDDYCNTPIFYTGLSLINDYYVKFDKEGNITLFYITDGTYQYYYEGEGLYNREINKGSNGNNVIEKINSNPEDENVVYRKTLKCENDVPRIE